MKFTTGADFRGRERKAVTIFGMSGVGKTRLASILRGHNWFHYSVDYRIGTRYMGEHIVDNFKREAMKVPLLRDLLKSDSIYISSNITFDNLAPLSSYIGKPGDRKKGGLSFSEYQRRQRRHHNAEVAALLDVPDFIEKARTIYGYEHFVCDTGGSLCEVVDPDDPDDRVLWTLSSATLMLYIRGGPDHTQTLIDRFRKHPKPIYYPGHLLVRWWNEFKQERDIERDRMVDPDEFAVWGFERLIHHRLPIYERIAEIYGYIVEAADVETLRDEADFLDLIDRVIGRMGS